MCGGTVAGLLTPPAGGNGWLYDVLTRAGLAPSTARTVNELVVRPLEVLIVVAAAAVAAHLGAKVLQRVLSRLAAPTTGRLVSPRASTRINTVASLVANIWRFVVVLTAIGIVLTMFGINLTPLLASATVLGATIGFGAQSLVRDYLSGVLLSLEDQFGIGDTISVNETTGIVEDLSLRVTRVRDATGAVWYLPNGEIRRLGNTSRGWVFACVDLPVAARGPADLDRARQVLLDAASEVARRPSFLPACPEPPRSAGLVDTDGTSCTLRILLRTTARHAPELEGELREALVRALMTAGLWPASTDQAQPPC